MKKKKEEKQPENNNVDLLSIGSAIKSTDNIHGNPKGTKAVLISKSEVENEGSLMYFIFPNGEIFVVSPKVVDNFFDLSTIWNIPEVKRYEYKDAETVMKDFRLGRFSKTWR